MAENYKHLYHQTKLMLEKYQDEIVPGLREQLEKRVEVVRCKDCWRRHNANVCPMRFEEVIEWDDDGYMETELVTHDYTADWGFCDRGERKDNG